MISYKFARRSFLRGLSVGSAPLLVPLLRNIEARAQGAAAPLRFLIIHHPLGALPGLSTWRPSASATTTNFTLPMESAPFAPLQKSMVMIDGINIVSATSHPSGNEGDPNSGGQNTHEGGMVAIMTGLPTVGMKGQQDHCAGGPSIDQVLLAQSPLLGGTNFPNPTPHGSLQLAADIRSDRDEIAPRVLSYGPLNSGTTTPDAMRHPLSPNVSPLDAYGQVFGNSTSTGTDAAKLLAQKESVITYLKSDLARLQTLVPSSEKDRIAAHTDAISQLEATLQTTYGGSPSKCTKPDAPKSFTNTTTGMQSSDNVSNDLGGVDYYVPNQPTSHPHLDLGQAQLRLIKAAFLCDMCRVATFMWSPGTNWVVFPGTFQGGTIPGRTSSPHHPPSHYNASTDTQTPGWLGQINQFYSTATAAILQEFATTPDVDGNMLLDNTVVVYLTEVARAYDHNQQNVPLIIFGGKNTKVKGGTFLKVTDGSLGTQTGGTGNRPFNDVWLALAPVFGVTMKSLGAQSQSTGPLPGIFSS